MLSEILWYSYLHVNGKVIPKRCFGPGMSYEDREDLMESDFVVTFTGAYPANSREEAEEKGKVMLGVV